MSAAALSLTLAATLLHPTVPQDGGPADGLSAVVNGEVITIGEVRRTVAMGRAGAFAGLTGGCAGEDDDTASVRDCMIDALLAYQEVRRIQQLGVDPAQVDEAYRELAASLGSPADFAAQQQRWGLTETGLRDSLQRTLLLASYVDVRFRSFVDVSQEERRRYYEETLVPDMNRRQIEVPAYEEVEESFILPILREAEVNARLQGWIRELRARASIQLFDR